ncbi:T9SS type A sorting domain-containing protein [uncultured Polaribacter sp.]|uniref:T9SS type A sorting domain-containing protein n=1 Tax=uncultured Polaribacter sp. TaxID=174711 RepID=UPI002629E0AD|nr:T9SS type A sorting domain-containing protein [uncultured Polaribacter sp.]
MNKKLGFSIIVIISLLIFMFYADNSQVTFENKKKEYVEYILNHPYTKRAPLTSEEIKALPKKDRPDLAFEQDFLRTMDPKTKKLHQDRLVKALKYGKKVKQEFSSKSAITFNWESRGPKTVAGRVRALMFDPNDTESKRVFAGGVSGGIWKNEDITDENSSWVMVNSDMTNFAVSAMTYDPVQNNTFYVGTGEGWGNADAVNGAGIWKTTDGGLTWNNLPSTTNFEYVYDIIVRNENGIGVIYAAMQDLENNFSEGTDLFRSVDGGNSWSIVSTEPIRDLELSSDNKIWAGTASGSILSSSNGVVFTSNYNSSLPSSGRVELSTAKSNSNVIYALIASRIENSNSPDTFVTGLGEIVKSIDAGVTFTNLDEPSDTRDSSIPNDDFTRGQAWYDLIIEVNPTNENEVYVGGVNTFKSTNGGVLWSKTSSWDSRFDNSVSYVHADIHNIVFRPSYNQLLIATDGGVFYSPDNQKNANQNSIFPRNLNLNITQFYSAAIDPVNSNGFMGGAQDNGTIYLFEPGISNSLEVLGGDGGFSFIDQTAVNATESIYYIASTQFNVSYLYDSSFPATDYITLVNNRDSGNFINASDYDDENNIFYSFNDNNEITRVTLKGDFENQGFRDNFNGVQDIISTPLFGNSDVTHIRVSPYNIAARKVFFGTVTGRLLIFDNTDESFQIINEPSNVFGAISCIELGASDDEILLTYSNYGVKSVWYTTDGGDNWTDVEGNLPDIPVRWSLFNPLDRKEVLLATESGIWKTNDVTAETVVWEPASSGMGSVRVNMLQYRASDNLILAATHGRGMFTANFTDNTASDTNVMNEDKVFTVYPTVSKGAFTVFAKNTLGKVKINIFDTAGRQVHSSSLDFSVTEKQPISLDINSGIYIVNLVDKNNNKSSRKIIIE